MARITLDGLDIELPADAAGAVQSFVKETGRTQAELQQKLDAQEEKIQAVVTEKTEAQDRIDASQEQVQSLRSNWPRLLLHLSNATMLQRSTMQ